MPRKAPTTPPIETARSPRSGRPPIEVRASSIAGLGVFATRRIKRGARIIEYIGERISDEEAARRYDDEAMEHHHTFLFAVDDDTVIDGGVDGNDARYFNHACAPNCEAVNEDGRIFIEALTDIEPGVELVYDYALRREEPWQDHWAELYACRCGAPTCRGTILESPKPPRKKAKGRATSGPKSGVTRRRDGRAAGRRGATG
jgi:SET domain-containing protein